MKKFSVEQIVRVLKLTETGYRDPELAADLAEHD
jgi:hypothetical protein